LFCRVSRLLLGNDSSLKDATHLRLVFRHDLLNLFLKIESQGMKNDSAWKIGRSLVLN
jgi:hypothetical protein